MPSPTICFSLPLCEQVTVDEVDPGALALLAVKPVEGVRSIRTLRQHLRLAILVDRLVLAAVLLCACHVVSFFHCYSRRPEPTSALLRPWAPARPASSRAAAAM